MYEAFFNLRKKPFELVPDPDFIYLSRSHKKAEIEFQTLKCVENCDLIDSETAENK